MSRCDEVKRHAIRLFARDGFGIASIRDLAREAGIQPGTLYCWYDSKDALLLEVICDHLQEARAYWLKRAAGGEVDCVQRLLKFVDAHLEFQMACYPRSVVVEFDRRNLDSAGRERTQLLAQAYENELIGLLEQGRAVGGFHLSNAGATAAGLLAMLTGLCHRELQNPAPAPQALFAYARHVALTLAGSVPLDAARPCKPAVLALAPCSKKRTRRAVH